MHQRGVQTFIKFDYILAMELCFNAPKRSSNSPSAWSNSASFNKFQCTKEEFKHIHYFKKLFTHLSFQCTKEEFKLSQLNTTRQASNLFQCTKEEFKLVLSPFCSTSPTTFQCTKEEFKLVKSVVSFPHYFSFNAPKRSSNFSIALKMSASVSVSMHQRGVQTERSHTICTKSNDCFNAPKRSSNMSFNAYFNALRYGFNAPKRSSNSILFSSIDNLCSGFNAPKRSSNLKY